MGSWFKRLWTDEVYFLTTAVALGRGFVSFLGALVTVGWIPTGTENGWKFGLLVMALSSCVPAGAYNRGPAKPGEKHEAAPPETGT